MSDIAIHVEGLGKRYRIGRAQKRHEALRDALTDGLGAPARWLRRNGNSNRAVDDDIIWALKDVSFEVKRGEVVGIIGRNGAGKSTLLKILSRITKPTEGSADVYGRMGTLLEVGTGFHAELSGRENIYLSGAIIGMKKAEIDRKFDEIVAFAEVEKFIDTPVKHYSSGMYVRLAFAVAAHLEPEVLLVDEVLAVGDAAFQKKCLGKMGEVAKEGRTVVFISHNMGAIGNLCGEVFWIDGGHLQARGQPAQVITRYLKQSPILNGEIDLTGSHNRQKLRTVYILWAATKNALGEITTQFEMGDQLAIEFDIFSKEPTRRVALSLDLKTSSGIPVLHLVDGDFGFSIGDLSGRRRVRVILPNLPLYPGTYLISVWAGDPSGQDFDYVVDCLSIDVITGRAVKRSGLSWNQGIFTCRSEWQVVNYPHA